jgi:SAM-dependent methyltransferase
VDLEPNASRFSGFAGLYDDVRPTPPDEVATLLCEYAGCAATRPALVVDLGSGTGLSSRWCATWADEVIGVEPSDDMRREAETVARAGRISYRSGWSHATGLPGGCADLVVAVQALHWMEPTSTLAEAVRLLRPGGVFAALACDWPPASGVAAADEAWSACRRLVRAHEATLAQGVQAWSKDEHLARLRASGHFRWCEEVCALRQEAGDADRFVALLRSQGDLQTLLKHGLTEAELGIEAFAAQAHELLGAEPRALWFTYRVRFGVI